MVFYSIAGWIWEVIICSVSAKGFINRGFLNGPYCPIYGIGGILVITLFKNIENPVELFLAGATLACILEYITSWLMEKLFHARWWDYSNHLFNINGRVCLLGAFAFGTLSVIAVLYVHPIVVVYPMLLSELAVSLIALGLFVLLLADIFYTVTRFSEFETKLKEFTERLNNAVSMMNGRIINSQERRLIKAFPKLRSIRYNEALEKIKQYVHNTRR